MEVYILFSPLLKFSLDFYQVWGETSSWSAVPLWGKMEGQELISSLWWPVARPEEITGCCVRGFLSWILDKDSYHRVSIGWGSPGKWWQYQVWQNPRTFQVMLLWTWCKFWTGSWTQCSLWVTSNSEYSMFLIF